MSATLRWLRKQLPGIVAVLVMVSMYLVSFRPTASEAETSEVANSYGFAAQSIAMPSGYEQQEIRKVNQEYQHIDGWISSVGAGIAMNDLDGDGLDNDLCITDPRIDKVVVTPTPGAGVDRYDEFALDPAPLPMNHAMAPMGCAPGDFNEDGRMDLLVYYWGRTPIVFLAQDGSEGDKALSAATYRPTELLPHGGTGTYDGPLWNTNAVAISDFDGDGHADIFIGNYFPDSPVLDHTVYGGVEMNRSLSNAANGGEGHFFRWSAPPADQDGAAEYEWVEDVLPPDISKGWVLGAAATDVDGDLLPELYLANDHGPDGMFHNRSRPGEIVLEPVYGPKSPLVPKSKRVGVDSFKGMGVDFGDLDRDGLYDMFVSNITTSFGIQETSYQFMAKADDTQELRDKLSDGLAPWIDESTDYDTAWGGWCWDVKLDDFNNDGNLEIAQANGFVKGEHNRWPQLQELATANDLVLEHPQWWPNIGENDDVAGSQRLNFFAPDGDRFVNVSRELGLDVPVPTRGIATGDADGDGLLDLAVARQWDQPVFYQNTGDAEAEFLSLDLTHDAGLADGPLVQGSPVVDAQVEVTTPDGRTLINRVDGGSGHSGKRSTDVHIGLGDVSGAVDVRITWRDRDGAVREQELELSPGRHALRLGAQVKER